MILDFEKAEKAGLVWDVLDKRHVRDYQLVEAELERQARAAVQAERERWQKLANDLCDHLSNDHACACEAHLWARFDALNALAREG